MFNIRQEKESPFYTGIFQGPDGKSKEFSTKSVELSSAQHITASWMLLSLAAQNRILTKRQYMYVAKTLYHIATGVKMLNMTVRECVKYFISHSGDKEEKTIENRKFAANAFLVSLGAEADGIIEDVTKIHVIRFRDQLSQKNEAASVNTRLAVIITFFNFAMTMGWIEKNPAIGVNAKDPNAKKNSKVNRRPFRRREAFMLIELATVEMTGVFVTDFHLGARQGDVTCMKIPKMTNTPEEDGVDVQYFNDKGEEDKSLPTLPEYGAFLSEFLLHHPNAKPGEPLFWQLGLKRKGTRNNKVLNEFDRICQAQGLRAAKTAPRGKANKRQYELVPHCIRHTVNMALKQSGMPKHVVCVFLGHNATSNQKYDHFEEQELIRQELFKAAGRKCRSNKPLWMNLQDIMDMTDYATEKLRRIRLGLKPLTLDEAEAFLLDRKSSHNHATENAAPQTGMNANGNT